MSSTESKKIILGYFMFIVGEEDSHPDVPTLKQSIDILSADSRISVDSTTGLKRFIDRRSRLTELLQMRELHPVINSSYRKRELVEYFCNLSRGDRLTLVNKFPDIIVAIPADFKLFKLDRPKHIAYRFANFGGATVEYPVFSILSFLEQLNKAQCLTK